MSTTTFKSYLFGFLVARNIKVYILVCACESINIRNRWMNGNLSRDLIYNGKHSWVDETFTFAIWYDGQPGSFFDWMFGYARRIGSSSHRNALMFSNEETVCPQNVTKWVNDDSAKLSCISQTTTVRMTRTTATTTRTTRDVPNTESSGNFNDEIGHNLN